MELLLRMAAHPSVTVALFPLRTLRALLRNESLARSPTIKALFPQLMTLSVARLLRVHDPPFCVAESSAGASGGGAEVN
jgi:hypothetical protein